MRELFVTKKQVMGEDGTVHSYEYSILVSELAVSSGVCCESYGVRVAGQDGDRHEIPDITVSMTRIDQLMDLLVRNAVTPCTLRDVVEDWL